MTDPTTTTEPTFLVDCHYVGAAIPWQFTAALVLLTLMVCALAVMVHNRSAEQ